MNNPFENNVNVNNDKNTSPRPSAKWLQHQDFQHIHIIEYTGWNADNFDYSFYVEPITSNEFINRCINSKCEFDR